MKRLILMRHAKSDWSAGLQDIERPLNKRGKRAAEALGDWLRASGLEPDEVLCSAAMRTRETLAGLALDDATTVTFTRDLYLAEPSEMAALLATPKGDCVLMIGHNPGIAHLAQALVASQPEHPQFSRYPTGATLVADFDIGTWVDLKTHSGTTIDFVVPRELAS